MKWRLTIYKNEALWDPRFWMRIKVSQAQKVCACCLRAVLPQVFRWILNAAQIKGSGASLFGKHWLKHNEIHFKNCVASEPLLYEPLRGQTTHGMLRFPNTFGQRTCFYPAFLRFLGNTLGNGHREGQAVRLGWLRRRELALLQLVPSNYGNVLSGVHSKSPRGIYKPVGSL